MALARGHFRWTALVHSHSRLTCFIHRCRSGLRTFETCNISNRNSWKHHQQCNYIHQNYHLHSFLQCLLGHYHLPAKHRAICPQPPIHKRILMTFTPTADSFCDIWLYEPKLSYYDLDLKDSNPCFAHDTLAYSVKNTAGQSMAYQRLTHSIWPEIFKM